LGNRFEITADLYVKTVVEATPSTSTRPEVNPHGIVTCNSVAEINLTLAEGSVVVPILTIELVTKPVPVIVTMEPAYPSTGEKELIVAANEGVSIGLDFITNSDAKEVLNTNKHIKLRTD
jgi:hypothetical protein